MNLLDAINDPAELRRPPRVRFAPLARRLRQFLLDIPRDRLVWDVGHQCYGHKVLTGRRATCTRCASSAASPGRS